jgi:STE24 endopeptidase
MNEDKATRYHRARRRLVLLETVAMGVVLAGISWLGFATGWRDAAEWLTATLPAPWREPVTLALVMVPLAAVLELAALPVVYLRSFELERRYELSSEPLRVWARDHAKASVLAFVLGLLIAQGLFWIARETPSWWWLWSAVATVVVSCVLVAVTPIVLLPLFYRVERLDRPALRERLLALAARAGVNVLDVYEWKMGDRTRKANAALTGLGRTRRILVSDTLLERYRDDEVEVVLAHELAHHKHADIWRSLGLEGVIAVVVFAGVQLAIQWVGPSLGIAGVADPASLPLMLLVGGALSFALQPVALARSRDAERRADAYAVALTGRPDALVSALRRLGQQNLAEDAPSKFTEIAFLTHPPIPQRIAAIRAASAGAEG